MAPSKNITKYKRPPLTEIALGTLNWNTLMTMKRENLDLSTNRENKINWSS